MAKRFTDNTIWEQDWFVNLPKDYKLFWQYLKDRCNHAGIFKPNFSVFNRLNGCKVDPETSLEYFNDDKERVRRLSNGRWFVIDFIVFQYGKVLNENNRVHESILKEIQVNDIQIDTIRGLIEVKKRSIRPQKEVKHTPKDIDIDKDKNNIYLREQRFIIEINNYQDKYSDDLLDRFFNYWSERNKSETKMRFEMEKTWELSKRLTTWSNNKKDWSNNGGQIDKRQDRLDTIINLGKSVGLC